MNLEADARRLRSRLEEEGLQPSTWGNGPGERYVEHAHDYDKVLVATAGSITFHLPAGARDVELSAGQRLDLPAGTRHAATVGPRGVTCLEAHLPQGSLSEPARRDPDW